MQQWEFCVQKREGEFPDNESYQDLKGNLSNCEVDVGKANATTLLITVKLTGKAWVKTTQSKIQRYFGEGHVTSFIK